MADLRRDLGEDGGAAEFGEALGFAAADADGQAGAGEEESGERQVWSLDGDDACGVFLNQQLGKF